MLKELKVELDAIAKAGRLKQFHARVSRVGTKINIRGGDLVDFTSWDFFNLGQNPKVKRALHSEIEQHGIASAASRLSSGTSPAHLSAEARIASFLGLEGAVLFSSHNQAVLSLLSAILSDRDCVIVDDVIQSPVQDAAYLVDAESLHFNSSDPDSLAKVLESAKGYKRKVIYIESVSPTTGVPVDLEAIIESISRSDVELIVDESYALGILGLRGAGVVESTRLPLKKLTIVGSLARGIGVYGGFIAGSSILIQYLINRSKTFQSENVVPSGIAASIEAALNLVELEQAGRETLGKLAADFRRELKRSGVNVDDNVKTPVVCINTDKFVQAFEIFKGLIEKGFLVEALSNGLILNDGGIVRLLLNSSHTESEVTACLAALRDLWKRVV